MGDWFSYYMEQDRNEAAADAGLERTPLANIEYRAKTGEYLRNITDYPSDGAIVDHIEHNDNGTLTIVYEDGRCLTVKKVKPQTRPAFYLEMAIEEYGEDIK